MSESDQESQQAWEQIRQMYRVAKEAVDEFLGSQNGVFHRNGMLTAIRLALLREFPELANDEDLDQWVELLARRRETARGQR